MRKKYNDRNTASLVNPAVTNEEWEARNKNTSKPSRESALCFNCSWYGYNSNKCTCNDRDVDVKN